MEVKVIKKKIINNGGDYKMSIKKVVAYVRVSTDNLEQLNSLESQKKYYIDKITSNNEWIYSGIYIDEGISGTQTKNRNDFLRMLEDASKNKFDMIVTKSISRFARNTVDTLTTVRRLKALNIAVYFEEENINTLDMAGELMLTILSSVAQQESENLSNHVKKGLKMKQKRGELIGFNKCYGYNYDKETKELKVNRNEAEMIKIIYEKYLEGHGATYIAKMLDDMKVIPPKKGKWCESTIRKILTNEKYIGDVAQGKTYTVDSITHKRIKNRGEEDIYYIENHHEPIISKELFDKVQYYMKSKKRNVHPNPIDYPGGNPFSKKIRCGFCGGKYTRRIMTNRTSGIPIWDCMKNVKSGVDSCSLCKSLREELISSCFVDGIQLLIKNNNSYILNIFNDYLTRIRNEKDYCYIKNKINTLLKNKSIDVFDSMIFGILIDHVIIGGYIDSNIDKCLIRFILKSNNANDIDNDFIIDNNQIINGRSNNYIPILDFDDLQRYYIYEKDVNGKNHKILKNKIKVRFEYIN